MCLPQGTRSYNRHASLQYLVEKLIKAGHLKQYPLRLRKSHFPTSQSWSPQGPTAPKAVINYINGGPSDEEQLGRSCASTLAHGTQSHRPRKPGRVLSGFNGSSTILGRHILPVQASPVTLKVQFSVVQELSPFNVILGRTWLHYMKVIPSTYHQMVSFLTDEGQIDLYGSQLAARQCYQIAREAGTSQEDASPPEPSIHMTNSNYWVRWTKIPDSRSLTNNPNFGGKHSPHEHQFPHDDRRNSEHAKYSQTNHDIFAWAHSDMKGIHPSIASHRLNVFSTTRPAED
ncbi:hypothetical protein CK203_104467 [Vitis vinifera]|uniref:Uncharacterized protein n=1 Tax=Vitis vinifera TaxID=29760 RepID=A0A438E9Y8_VITVI|nr:hypothetical protein CK203_104467 [Vitis vinifera]